jgi:glycosyltransferase involved in cell wall biosynthesis
VVTWQVLGLVRATPSLAGRVVEVKFLRGSRRTLVGPNTHIGPSFKQRAKAKPAGDDGGRGSGGSGGGGVGGSFGEALEPSDVFCFNLWWRVGSPQMEAAEVFDAFERVMHVLGAVPHFGKLHRIPSLPLPKHVGKARGVGYLEQTLRGWEEFTAVQTALAATPAVPDAWDPNPLTLEEPVRARQGEDDGADDGGDGCDGAGGSQTEHATGGRERLTHISVLLPVWNAMPWLPLTMRDLLRQTGRVALELCVANDASTDGSGEFLEALAAALGDRGSVEAVHAAELGAAVPSPASSEAATEGLTDREHDEVQMETTSSSAECSAKRCRSLNPALLMAPREAEMTPKECGGVPAAEAAIAARPLTVDAVLQTARPQHRLRVLSFADGVNRGQGAAMTLALHCSSHHLIGHMESDDERPAHAFATLAAALAEHMHWDGACSLTRCIGWDRPGMRRYVDWQNRQRSPVAMRAARFVEIPCLHQAGLFRRAAVLAATDHRGAFRDDVQWAVDLHFWLSWFHARLTVGKVPHELFLWRQHPGQQTRSHGRLSIANLRKCKVHFLCRGGGPIYPWLSSSAHSAPGACASSDTAAPVQVWGCGTTLTDWVADLRAAAPSATVTAVEWRPGDRLPDDVPDRAAVAAAAAARERAEAAALVRLFAFSMDKPQARTRAAISDWDDELDLFVA